jgi:hypothetical protein
MKASCKMPGHPKTSKQILNITQNSDPADLFSGGRQKQGQATFLEVGFNPPEPLRQWRAGRVNGLTGGQQMPYTVFHNYLIFAPP